MQQIPAEQLVAEWQALVSRYPDGVPQALAGLATEHADALAERFYREMLADPLSSGFLSHEQVHSRLHRSMSDWIVALFSARSDEDMAELIELQRKVGHVHARIEIPVSLVLRGTRALKGGLLERIAQVIPEPSLRRDAGGLASGLIDLAVEVMCHAFSQSHDRNSRAEEAYRLFSVSHNIGTEKERQRAALLDWENQLMFDLATGIGVQNLQPLSTSEFGLWFRHKAAHAFQGSPENSSILDYISQIDGHLPALSRLREAEGQADSLQQLRQIRELTRSIKFLLDGLFAQASDLEAGRDVLTRLLNRKFLPVVLGKELLYSRQSGSNFAVLMLDVDHFKTINDTHGHEAGDAVLQQMATLLAGNTRGGRLRLSPGRRGVPADPGGHRHGQGAQDRRQAATVDLRGALPPAGRRRTAAEHQRRRGHARRPSGLPAPAQARRPGALRSQARRPQPLRAGAVAGRASPTARRAGPRTPRAEPAACGGIPRGP